MTLRALPLPDPGTPDLRSRLRFLAWVLRRQWWLQLRGVWWGVLWMAAQGVVPALLGVAVQRAVAGRSLVAPVAGILALGAVQAVAGMLRHRLAVETWITAASRVQQLVARHAAYLGADLQRQVATGEVVAVSASDVEKIGSAFDVMARFGGAVVAFAGVAAALLATSPVLGGVVLAGLPVFALTVVPLLRPLEARESAQRAKLGRATELASDTVAGLRVLRGIGGEELFLDRFRQASADVRRAAFATARVRSVLEALQVALPGGFVVAVTWLGARLAVQGRIGVGQLVAFYGWTAFLVLPLRTITEAAHKWTRARVAADRVVRVLSLERTPRPSAPKVLSRVPVRARPAALHDLTTGLEIPAGCLTALVVADPVAASLLVDRLGGYPSGQDGEAPVLLEGVVTSALPLPTLRARVLLQDKDPVLLSGSVAELLAVPSSGRVTAGVAVATASADDVLDAVADPSCGDVDRFDGRVTERGRTLSGGQRQRLALARSLVADPPVLVLDEPTSAVDAHTEARVARSVRQLRRGRTTVVVTTSPLLLEQADHVVLLDGDPLAVTATGTHRELLHDERYRAVVTREEDS